MDPYLDAELDSALTHTRLLRVDPSEKSDRDAHLEAPLVCTLTVVKIDNPGRFKALSYTWGDQTRPWPCWAFIDNIQVPITRSLDAALRRFRDTSEPVTLWVDQLCINQVNSDEKSKQVSKMGEIYSNAEQVLAWLGPSADGSDAVMDAFAKFGQEGERLHMMSYYTRERLPQLHRMMFEPMPEFPDNAFKEFRKMQLQASSVCVGIRDSLAAWFQRKYFTRVWVIQEFALGEDTVFVCGEKVVARRHVLLALDILGSSINHMERDESTMSQDFEFFQDNPTTAFLGAWRRRKRANGDELFNLLRATYTNNSMHASDGRDRVYALLGLAVDTGGLCIEPDYGNSTFKDVMTQTAKAIIGTGRVALLSYSQHPKDSQLPSWVPDWRPTLRSSYYTIVENASPHLFSASGSTTAAIVPTTDPDILGLEGFCIDIVEQVGDLRWDEDWKHAGFTAHLKQVDQFCQLSAAKAHRIYPSSSHRAEAIWRVPIADIYRYNGVHKRASSDERTSSDMKDAYKWFFKRNDILCNLESNPNQELNRVEFKQIMKRGQPYHSSLSNTTHLRLYMTTKGFLGLADPMVEPGDMLVVFKGARIPYVLRPKDVSTREFAFIGDAYCDGMMDGEVLENGMAAPFFLV